MTAAPTRDEIIALETAYWDAMKKKDGKATAALSGEVSLVTGTGGVIRIPQAKMGAMTESGDWELESYTFDKVEVATPTPDVAICAYTVRQTMKMAGKRVEKTAADSSTWIRGKDGWQCHAHSETVLEG